MQRQRIHIQVRNARCEFRKLPLIIQQRARIKAVNEQVAALSPRDEMGAFQRSRQHIVAMQRCLPAVHFKKVRSPRIAHCSGIARMRMFDVI